ncbi:hypothetical protein AX760_25195 [Pararhizobium antarcticum]|uniref:diguanylate cyclase n=2 Tax=Pararhizobium antarcticum TaxID=1798805 RepID=A0A657LXQ3_9HYPH|nr:hypothetical protein AX760_25195 [Pararhizobium antarcticum]
MFTLSWRSDSDALAEYRPRIGALISSLGSVLLLPFIAVHVVQGRLGLAAMFSAAAFILLLNVWAINKRQRPFIPFGPVVSGLAVAVCTSVWVQGHNGLFWAYPVLFIGFFILPRRWANITGFGLLIGVSLVTWQSIGLALATRVSTTLFLNFVMINLVLNVLDHLHDTLVRQAILDPLTGVYNRRHFQKQLDAAVGRQGSSEDALLIFDIDHFKRINDAYGHDIGDHVLRELVHIALSFARPGDDLFRLGGEEFAILLYDTPPETALELAHSLRSRIEAARLLPNQGIAVTVSVGIASSRSEMRAEAWFKEADLALYEAKHRGRNCVVTYENLNAPAASTVVSQPERIAS